MNRPLHPTRSGWLPPAYCHGAPEAKPTLAPRRQERPPVVRHAVSPFESNLLARQTTPFPPKSLARTRPWSLAIRSCARGTVSQNVVKILPLYRYSSNNWKSGIAFCPAIPLRPTSRTEVVLIQLGIVLTKAIAHKCRNPEGHGSLYECTNPLHNTGVNFSRNCFIRRWRHDMCERIWIVSIRCRERVFQNHGHSVRFKYVQHLYYIHKRNCPPTIQQPGFAVECSLVSR